MKVNILGTDYTIKECTVDEDSYLQEYDGYCDKSSKEIVICKKRKDCQLKNWEWYRKKVIRHEIIHAFLYESGLCAYRLRIVFPKPPHTVPRVKKFFPHFLLR